LHNRRLISNAAATASQTSIRAIRWLGVSVTALSLASCSFAIPGGEPVSWSGNVSDEVTGSIRPKAPELSQLLDQEDKRRAAAALAVALDPQGAGASVNWDNPQTQAKGSFTPAGPPYPSDGRVCRGFRAEIAAKETQERLQGAACRERTADWELIEVKPGRKAGV
jgi:surface antigen